MLRYYSIASFASILLAAAAMLLIYRSIAITGIERLAESANLMVAQTAMNPIRAELADFLAEASQASPKSAAVPLPPALDSAISRLMADAHVSRVKIYNRAGVVAFSTKHAQIGSLQADNPGFVAAMKGKVSVKLVYRDTLNPFDGVTEDDNLVQSYIPVRRRATEPVLGVFELYTDVDPLVHQAERFELLAVAATVLVLATLYVVLLLVVRRASAIIDSQALTIREKTAMLEALSRESLRREERERKKFATDLHEDLAQTLSAVKIAVEGARAGPPAAQRESLDAVVPDLQRAISKVRAIAVDLRPPSLDDLGLVATLNTLCREFEEAYPQIRIERGFDAAEARIPAALKIVIYRILEAFLRLVGERRAATAVFIGLSLRDATLELRVEADAGPVVAARDAGGAGGATDAAFLEIRERTIISGGRLAVEHDEDGGVTLVAAWRQTALAGQEAWPG